MRERVTSTKGPIPRDLQDVVCIVMSLWPEPKEKRETNSSEAITEKNLIRS